MLTNSSGRVVLIRIGKAALGMALLAALLLWEDNARKLLATFRHFDPNYIVALLLIALGLNGISSIKWSLFIQERGVAISRFKLFQLYLIGRFFNNFLPSMVGGDLARVYLLGRTISSQSRSLASVFLERATGIVGLTLLAVCFAVLEPEILHNRIIALALAAAILGCAIGAVCFYRPSVSLRAIKRFEQAPVIGGIARKGAQAIQDITYFRHRHRLLVLSLLYSFAFHLLAGINVYTACMSIGLIPEFTEVLVITPVILLLSMIPVSPNNIGWWEWCFSVLLVNAGATTTQGLAVALTLRAVTLVISVAGGLLFLRHRLTDPATTNQ